jgi:rhodanese-related sulfurtransferase
MSSIAAKELVFLGYTNIMNLEGGFNAWIAAGFPME